MVLTLWGYLFLALSGLAVCLFCWLSYSSIKCAARPGKKVGDDFLARAARNISGAVPGR